MPGKYFIGDRKLIDIIYLDFETAFDKIPHVEWMKKFSRIKVRSNLLLWIRNWLRDKNYVTAEVQQIRFIQLCIFWGG